MTKHATKPAPVLKPERHDLIRQLLIAGVPDWKIRRNLIEGIDLGGGRVCKVHRNTVTSDMAEIGEAYRVLHDDTLAAERIVGAATERLARIADKAEAAGQFNAAIRANLALVDIVGRHNPRWSRRAGDGVDGADETPDNPYEEMTDEELRAELEAKRERVARLELVHDATAS